MIGGLDGTLFSVAAGAILDRLDIRLPSPAPAGVNMDDTLVAMRNCGLQTRDVDVAGKDVTLVVCPAFAQLPNGTWIALLGRVDDDWTVMDASGVRPIRSEDLIGATSGKFLEVFPTLKVGRNIWLAMISALLANKRNIAHIAIMSIVIQGLALAMPQFTRLAMDRVMPEGATSLLMLVTFGLAASAVFQSVAGWFRQRAILYITARNEFSITYGFTSHLLSLPYPFLSSKKLGWLLQAQLGVQSAKDFLTERNVGVVFDGITGCGYLILMAATFPNLTALVIGVAMIAALITLLVGRKQSAIQRKEMAVQADGRGYLAEIIRGMATIKAAGAETPCLGRWVDNLRETILLSLRRQRAGLWVDIGLDGLRYGLTAAILVWGAMIVLQNEATVGQLMAFVQMSTSFLASAIGIANFYLGAKNLQPQIEKTQEILAIEPEPVRVQRKVPIAAPVILDDVWFRYDQTGPWVLEGFGLHVGRDERYWLSGPSGFGKSTLLRLMAGLYVPERGKVTIAGFHPHEVRARILYLPQFVRLHGVSIQENLQMFAGGTSRERILEAAAESGLDGLVSRLPMGYGTILPQGGGSLSGGQRQLLAITAAMASERPLLLLDEAMANMDWITRVRLFKRPMFNGKTIIHAGHDESFRAETHPLPDHPPFQGNRI